MTLEKPQVRVDVEFSADHALVEIAAFGGDFGDAVEHQHRRRRQARIAGAEHLAAGAGEQLLAVERGRSSHGQRIVGENLKCARLAGVMSSTRPIHPTDLDDTRPCGQAMRSAPPIYGRSTSGTVIEPSAPW